MCITPLKGPTKITGRLHNNKMHFQHDLKCIPFLLQCLFAHSLRKFSMRDWGIEQKWMSILLPLLLLYNGTFQVEIPYKAPLCWNMWPHGTLSGYSPSV